ncbi:hypothetical protein CG716_03615 [Mycolicibacterium sphagni]|uniref:Uncharacterized protein n=1 Tax=Mycolicibacterium sphagni TaxID=1786 RepID=A0A255E2Q2_9MYCO|nr:hypothetical protein CG716_03615 [Mycolicibacterium sphagni]
MHRVATTGVGLVLEACRVRHLDVCLGLSDASAGRGFVSERFSLTHDVRLFGGVGADRPSFNAAVLLALTDYHKAEGDSGKDRGEYQERDDDDGGGGHFGSLGSGGA